MAETIRKAVPTLLTGQPERTSGFAPRSINERLTTSNLNPPFPRPWSSADNRDSKAPGLSPAPAFLETTRQSKDDFCVAREPPVTPKRPGVASRGLSLQLSMPPRDTIGTMSPNAANMSANLANRVPLSPKLDSTTSYGSTASVLPRRSRGLDYTRACTNLHHSTLAEQSSPDSSPVIGGGRGMNIPRRGHLNGIMPESPMFSGTQWSNVGMGEKNTISSSLGSVNMLDSASDSESSDDDLMRDEETIHMTPQIAKHGGGMINPFNGSIISSPSVEARSSFSQAAANLLSFQRRTRRGRSTRHSSSSASGNSNMPSPVPGSPTLLKSFESSTSNSYFPKELTASDVEKARRQSLSLGTNDLHISESVEREDGMSRLGALDALGIPISASNSADERRNVIRRTVNRRSNMLPKTKTFARIRAALQEESSPVDTESKREAEVIRQVRDGDSTTENIAPASQPTTTASSPYLMPATAGAVDPLDDLTELMGGETPSERRPSVCFNKQLLRKPSGSDFFSTFDTRVRTPPPQLLPRGSSSTISEDISMDTPASSLHSMAGGPRPIEIGHSNSSPSRSSTPVPTVGDITRKTLGKRRRDDDLDPNLFKRRAVSPGLSLQNSPILPPSPMQKDGSWWQTKSNRENSTGTGSQQQLASAERVSSNGSNASSGVIGKRVGMQGMNDTNDGMMNMSIE